MTESRYLPIVDPKLKLKLSLREKNYNSLILDASRSLILSGCRNLSTYFDIHSNTNYYEFISWCYETSTPTGWELSTSLIKFLDYKNIKLPNTLAEELLLLCCSQWTYMDKSEKSTIIIAYGGLKKKLFGASKSNRANSFREVFYVSSDFGLSHVANSKKIMYWVLDTNSENPYYSGMLI